MVETNQMSSGCVQPAARLLPDRTWDLLMMQEKCGTDGRIQASSSLQHQATFQLVGYVLVLHPQTHAIWCQVARQLCVGY